MGWSLDLQDEGPRRVTFWGFRNPNCLFLPINPSGIISLAEKKHGGARSIERYHHAIDPPWTQTFIVSQEGPRRYCSRLWHFCFRSAPKCLAYCEMLWAVHDARPKTFFAYLNSLFPSSKTSWPILKQEFLMTGDKQIFWFHPHQYLLLGVRWW